MPFEDDRQSPPRESELQRASRCMHETRELLARQEAIVAEMEATSSPMVAIGRRLLEIMRITAVNAERQVTYLLEKGIR